MLKSSLTLLALISATACASVDEPQVTRNYTGTLVGCPGLTGVSAQYSQPIAGLPVRCGPQKVSPISYR